MSKPLRVLIVEDSENDALLLVRRLERSGFELAWKRVETVEGLRTALADQTWDIAFSDHSMPRFRGRDALAIVKEQGLDIPFVVLSGAISEEEAVAAMQAGAVDYVRKDNLTRLIPVVERELRSAQERRKRQQAEAAQRAGDDPVPAAAPRHRPLDPVTVLEKEAGVTGDHRALRHHRRGPPAASRYHTRCSRGECLIAGSIRAIRIAW